MALRELAPDADWDLRLADPLITRTAAQSVVEFASADYLGPVQGPPKPTAAEWVVMFAGHGPDFWLGGGGMA